MFSMRGCKEGIILRDLWEIWRGSFRSKLSESTLRQSLVKTVSLQSGVASWEMADYDSFVR